MPRSRDADAGPAVLAGRGGLRLTRAVSAALGCLLAATVAHRLGGGVVPAQVALALTAGAAGTAWLLAARRLTRGQITGLVVLAQVVVHAACAGDGMEMTGTMLAVHVLATAATVAAIDHGESLAWRVAHHLALRPVHRLRPVPLPVLPDLAAPGETPAPHAVDRETSRSVRGPPVGV